MKQFTIKLLVVLFFCVAQIMAVQSQDLKIGFVDMARILKEAPQADMARKKLKDEFDPRDKKIVGLQTRLKKLNDKQGRDAAVMSEGTRKKLDREIISLKRDIKRAREEFTEDFNLLKNEELSKLQKLIIKTTVKVAEDNKYDIILSDNVLYNSKRADITEIVLRQLRTISKPKSPDSKK